MTILHKIHTSLPKCPWSFCKDKSVFPLDEIHIDTEGRKWHLRCWNELRVACGFEEKEGKDG
jgi:hypothetical protein